MEAVDVTGRLALELSGLDKALVDGQVGEVFVIARLVDRSLEVSDAPDDRRITGQLL